MSSDPQLQTWAIMGTALVSYLRTLITTATVVSTLFVCWSALAGPPLASNSSSGDTKDIVEFLQPPLLSTLHKRCPGSLWPPVSNNN